MADDSTGRDSDKFMLRLPNGMRDRIAAAAKTNKRSMNAEIVSTLEEAYPAPISENEGDFLETFRNTKRFFYRGNPKYDAVVDQAVAAVFFDVLNNLEDYYDPDLTGTKKIINDEVEKEIVRRFGSFSPD